MKFLIIRFSSIGDIVLTTPVIRCLKKQVQNAEVHFLLRKSYSSVVDHNPYIDKKYFYDDLSAGLLTSLKNEHYDAVIDLQKNFRSFRIKKSLGVRSYSFDKLNIQKWLLVNFKINLLPDEHIVDRYMRSVESFGVKNDGEGLDYFISKSDEEVVNELPDTHRSGFLAWVIGARHFTKRLPIEKMISIAGKIKSPVVLLGDEGDAVVAGKLTEVFGSRFFNACGKYSLNQSAALVKHSTKVITHDTGLMHIAAAFKKDIISIWGNTIPEFGMYPYVGKETELQTPNSKFFSSKMLEVTNLPCRPCSKIGFSKCPKGHFKCMQEIDESVFVSL